MACGRKSDLISEREIQDITVILCARNSDNPKYLPDMCKELRFTFTSGMYTNDANIYYSICGFLSLGVPNLV